MSDTTFIIEDPNQEIPGTTLNERLERYRIQKLEFSTRREQEWLDSPSTLEKIISNIQKIHKAINHKLNNHHKQK